MINMRKYIAISLVFWFLTTVLSINAQEVIEQDEQLESAVLRMFKAVDELDYDTIFDMSHPAIFEIAPKESLVEVFKTTFEGNEDFSMAIEKGIPEYNISSIYKQDDQSYAFVDYTMKMTMSFKKQEFDEEGKKMMSKVMEAQGMKVSFISDSDLKIVMENVLTILLQGTETNNKWVMINYQPDSPLFYNVLSKDIIEKARSYHQELLLNSKE